MAENNQMIQRPQMGFLKRIRKWALIRNIDGDKYKKAPSYLKEDIDVVGALIKNSPDSTDIIADYLKSEAVSQDPTLFEKMPVWEQKKIVKKSPEYIVRMSEDEAISYAVNEKEYIKYLPTSLQEQLLTQGTLVFSPSMALSSIEYFSYDVVERHVSTVVQNARSEEATDTDKKLYEEMCFRMNLSRLPIELNRKLIDIDNTFVNKLSTRDIEIIISENPELIKNIEDIKWANWIETLPVQLQLRLANIDNRVVGKISMEALEQFVGNNPYIIKNLDEEVQLEYVKRHPEYVGVLPVGSRCHAIEMKKNTSALIAVCINKPEDILFDNPDSIKLAVLYKAKIDGRIENNYASLREIYIDDVNNTIEMAKFEPAFLCQSTRNNGKVSYEQILDGNKKILDITKKLAEEIKEEYNKYVDSHCYDEKIPKEQFIEKIKTHYEEMVASYMPELAINNCNDIVQSFIEGMEYIVEDANKVFANIHETEKMYYEYCQTQNLPGLTEKQKEALHNDIEAERTSANNSIDARCDGLCSKLAETWAENENWREADATLKEIYKHAIDDPKILDALSKLTHHQLNSTDVPKVLLNSKVMSSVSADVIIEYINNPSIETLKDIVITTYGEHARQIFEDRPELSTEQIANLDIFDKTIVDKFGIGAVHSALTYTSDTNLAAMLGDLARNPEKMDKYELLESAVGEYFGDTVLDMESKIVAFYEMEELLNGLSLDDLTDERKKNLLLAINDRSMFDLENETRLISLKTLDDLDSYENRRNAMYDDYIQKMCNGTCDTIKIKEAISKRLFGMPYDKSGALSTYSQRGSALAGINSWYNLETFTSDERTIKSGMFTNDELDQLELATILTKIYDPKVLKEVYTTLTERENILSPTDFKKTKDKIPLLYATEMVNSLLTVDNAKERASAGEKGISYELTEDGFEVIKLSGAEFRAYVHVTGLNNSGIYENALENRWKTLENGCSTISGSIVEPQKLKGAYAGNGFELGFASISPKQIIGMGITDIHVSHTKRKLDPEMANYTSFNYPEQHSKKTVERIEKGIDAVYAYDEVVATRTQAVVSEIKEGTFGGRIMPDYIVVRGEITEEHKEMAKKLGSEEKPIAIVQLDEAAYEDIVSEKEVEETSKTERQRGEVVNEIKKIAKNDDMEI